MLNIYGGCRGRDRMVFGSTATYAIIIYLHSRCEFEFKSYGQGYGHGG
jgi:hypothetical protein